MHKIACFGDNCVDYYDQSDTSFYGGNPVNVAVYTKRLGFDAAYIGAVGNDAFGHEMLKRLKDKGVDVSHTHMWEGKTALTHVSIVNGDRVFGDYDEGVMENFALSEEDINFMSTHDLAVTGLWGKCEKDLVLLKEKGLRIAFDCSDRPYDPIAEKAIEHVNILFFSDDHSSTDDLKKIMKERQEKGPEIVVATRGEKGSLLYDGERYIEQGILKVNVADTMGAGDSFIAGFLNALLQGKNLDDCMMDGSLCSKETLSYHGAW